MLLPIMYSVQIPKLRVINVFYLLHYTINMSSQAWSQVPTTYNLKAVNTIHAFIELFSKSTKDVETFLDYLIIWPHIFLVCNIFQSSKFSYEAERLHNKNILKTQGNKLAPTFKIDYSWLFTSLWCTTSWP